MRYDADMGAARSCPELVLVGRVYVPREAESGALCVTGSEREDSLCGGYR